MTNLEQHANNIRKNIVAEVYSAKSGHPGGSLSAAEILTELYFEQMDINKENIDSILVNDTSKLLNKGNIIMSVYPKDSIVMVSNRIPIFKYAVNIINTKTENTLYYTYFTVDDTMSGILTEKYDGYNEYFYLKY